MEDNQDYALKVSKPQAVETSEPNDSRQGKLHAEEGTALAILGPNGAGNNAIQSLLNMIPYTEESNGRRKQR